MTAYAVKRKHTVCCRNQKGCCDHIRDNYARTLEEIETYYEDSAATAFAE